MYTQYALYKSTSLPFVFLVVVVVVFVIVFVAVICKIINAESVRICFE